VVVLGEAGADGSGGLIDALGEVLSSGRVCDVIHCFKIKSLLIKKQGVITSNTVSCVEMNPAIAEK
jgi:hypothetical protein